MADRPILYSGPMVVAQLEGRKGQTRRLPTRLKRFGKITEFGASTTKGYDFTFRDKAKRWHDLKHDELLKVLPWQVGDRLYVRETLRRKDGVWHYAADGALVTLDETDRRVPDMVSWAHHREGDVCVAIHMPRWASRLTDIVTDVRVQRLQEISEEDAKAEGCPACSRRVVGLEGGCPSFICGYRQLWGQINGAGSWDANPWIIALTFTVEKRNIDHG